MNIKTFIKDWGLAIASVSLLVFTLFYERPPETPAAVLRTVIVTPLVYSCQTPTKGVTVEILVSEIQLSVRAKVSREAWKGVDRAIIRRQSNDMTIIRKGRDSFYAEQGLHSTLFLVHDKLTWVHSKTDGSTSTFSGTCVIE
jgi:hypothetical protein